ncbi:winged helix-turn-helix transcriptional regulator [Streptomyces tuirus]|uniref:Winged helix-turn-helix transcriptional regulator n=1 Tax=Streptomyces tuirus TaxID=68278 RepID=A0A941FD50_9ACTN|nr:winged helix-turn-helix transcriptional regulator [Streptomyces tuirus]
MAPKWRELADRLAEQIKSGEYPPGAQLPQIRELVEAGEGSKETVHKAYKALETEGLVTSTRGHGTVVRPAPRLSVWVSPGMTSRSGATGTKSHSSPTESHRDARTSATSRRRP